MFFSRGPNKIQDPYVMKDFYAAYKDGIDNNELYDISFNEFVKINKEFYQDIMDHILLKNGSMFFPYGLGDLFVYKSKLKLSSIDHKHLDWKKTNETGKRVYHLNEHTNGYKYAFNWTKSRSRVKNMNLYRCQLTRGNKRRLAKLIKEDRLDYFEKR